MPEICEHGLGLLNSFVYYAIKTNKMRLVLIYSVDFKTIWELWNPLSKTVLRKGSFIWNKEPVNIGNNPLAQKYLAQ